MKWEQGRGPGLQTYVPRSIKNLEKNPKTDLETPLSGLDPQGESWGWKLQICWHVDTQELTLAHRTPLKRQQSSAGLSKTLKK